MGTVYKSSSFAQVRIGNRRQAPPVLVGQRGQALVEFVVVAITFLVPTFLMLPVLAEVISARQDAEVAIRYASWERTVWNLKAPASYPDQAYAATTVKGDPAAGDANQIGREIDQRIFSPGETPITSAVMPSATGSGVTELKPFMQISQPPASAPAPILAFNTETNSYASSSAQDTAPTGIADRIAPLSVAFKLNKEGLVQSQVDVSLIQFAWLGSPFNLVPGLTIQRSNTLFTDAWNPGGRDHAVSLIQNVVPEHYLDTDGVHRLQNFVGASPIRKEVRYPSLNLGYVTIDPVPASRLSAH